MWLSIYHPLLGYNTAFLNRNGIICMLYTLFPWDCSSIGQSTALSRRKLRVRAPSVPTDPINTQFISPFSVKREMKRRTRSTLLFQTKILFIRFFFLFAFLIKQISKFPLLQLVPIDGRETYVDRYNSW